MGAVMVTQHCAFGEFENAVSSVDLFPCRIAFAVAKVGVQQKVVDVEQTSRFEDAPDIRNQCFLIAVGNDAGEDGAEQDGVERGVREINVFTLHDAEVEIRELAFAACDQLFRKVDSAEVAETERVEFAEDASVAAADIENRGVAVDVAAEDGGATGVSGTSEAALNLDISLRLRDLLRLCGVRVSMIRETDTAVYSDGCRTISEKKVSDIKNRTETVNQTEDALLLIEDTSRETTAQFMKMNRYVDVLIPRGGAGLIRTVVENSTIPVIETGTGNCHIYVDETADLSMAVDIILNAKTQRVGVCNACESIVVHENVRV